MSIELGRHRDRWARVSGVIAPLVAVIGVIIVWLSAWRGVDVPAQVYRVEMFRQYGWVLWDSRWYGGHYLLPYSVLFPPLGAALGLYGAAALSAGGAAWAFDRLMRTSWQSRSIVPSLVFAVGTVVPVAIGQFPFLSGEAAGLFALYSARTRRRTLAIVFALCCSLLSPVAGAFLVLVLTALAFGSPRSDRWTLLGLAGVTASPLVVLNISFYDPGTFPFWGSDLVVVLVLCALGFFLLPTDARPIRIALVLYAAASVTLFALPNALGGNFVRLASAVAPALVIAWCRLPGRRLMALTVAPLLLWQMAPAWGAIQSANQDPSGDATYYQPLLSFIATQPTTGRIEIPFTLAHWEAAFVAPHVSLARGWERQTDRADNPIFYGAKPVSATAYKAWLDHNGVQWVALPDVALDYSAHEEAALLRHPPPYLDLVWSNAHWHVWKVTGSPGIVNGDARLVSVKPDRITVVATAIGTATLRVHYTSTWTVVSGQACVSASPDGWTRLTFSSPGRVQLASTLFGDGDDCAS
jgi:hypothetical protein